MLLLLPTASIISKQNEMQKMVERNSTMGTYHVACDALVSAVRKAVTSCEALREAQAFAVATRAAQRCFTAPPLFLLFPRCSLSRQKLSWVVWESARLR